MKFSAWRIVKRKHARRSFDGEGAPLFGGRWSSPGYAVVYAAQSQSLAALELLVHLESAEVLEHYMVLEVDLDERLVTKIRERSLPKRWRNQAPPAALRAIGDNWLVDRRSAALRVPSAIVPAESNFVLNPRHPDFPKIEIHAPAQFRFGKRLLD